MFIFTWRNSSTTFNTTNDTDVISITNIKNENQRKQLNVLLFKKTNAY